MADNRYADELFRLLLLSMLEDVLSEADGNHVDADSMEELLQRRNT